MVICDALAGHDLLVQSPPGSGKRLDEADRMLDMGFRPGISFVLTELAEEMRRIPAGLGLQGEDHGAQPRRAKATPPRAKAPGRSRRRRGRAGRREAVVA